MKQKDLNTWDELEEEIQKLYEFLKSKRNSNSKRSVISSPLFRGQRRSALWNLSTTLERYMDESVSVESYNRYLQRIKPTIESYTKEKWEVKDLNPDNTFFPNVSNYEFMAYVRHHGFPSPLLDWSQSLYIALFFAFQKASINERVAIYTYVEDLGEGKGGSSSLSGCAPMIFEFGSYVSTDKRHFMQQGQYTVCAEKHDGNWVYCSHENYFSTRPFDNQDYLRKFTLPGDIKNQVLEKLQSMNINSFTLFGTEDSLMDMLAFKEILGKKTLESGKMEH